MDVEPDAKLKIRDYAAIAFEAFVIACFLLLFGFLGFNVFFQLMCSYIR